MNCLTTLLLLLCRREVLVLKLVTGGEAVLSGMTLTWMGCVLYA